MKTNFATKAVRTLLPAFTIHGTLLLLAARALAADCSPPPAGLVSWWRGEGSANDSAQTNQGTLLGGVSYAAGEVGQSFSFNSSNAAVKIPASALLDVGNGAGLTVEAWIKPTDVTGAYPLFEWNDGNYWGVHFYIAPGQPTAGSPGPAGPGQLYANVVDSVGGWHQLGSAAGAVAPGLFQHVALTYDQASGVAKIYRNGEVVSQLGLGSFALRTAYDLYLGRRQAPPAEAGSFAGLMDEPSLYNRALTSNEIAAIFAAGAAGKCGPVAPPLSGPPVITGFAPKSGTNGTVVTLSGTNFSPVAASNLVYFGAVRAMVTAAGATSLTVTVPVGATFAPPTVTVGGLAAFAKAPFMPTFNGDGAAISSSNFAPRVDIANPIGAHRTVIADLDGDGKPDLAVSGGVQHGISLYRNIGSAGTLDASSFAPRVDILTLPVADSPWDLLAADVDGDGRLDLIEANRGDNKVSILRNVSTPGSLGTNSFAPSVDLSVADLPLGIVVRDLDGDGRADLAVGNFNSGNVAVFRNIGTAGSLNTNSFAAPVFFTTEAGTHSLGAEDLDGDGKADLAAVNANASSVSILRNTSTPGTINSNSFAPQFSLATPEYTHHVKTADLDGDGKPDLLVASVHGHALSVFRNIASPGTLNNSSFAARVDFPLAGRGHTISLGDLNGDNKLDVVVDSEINDAVSVFQNLSTPGSFTAASLGPRVDLTTGYNAWGSSVGDLDGDGRPDIVFANTYDNTISLYRNLSGVPPVTASAPVITSFSPKSGTNGTIVTLTGLNFSPVPANNIVYFGAVRATVTSASATSLTVVVPTGATYAPITETVGGLVASSPTPFQPVFAGGNFVLSAASFQPRFDLAGGDGAHRSSIADLDGDGKPDLAVADVYGHTVSLFRNVSTAGTLATNSFAPRVELAAPGGGSDNPYGFGTADVDGDGKLDLVACDRLGNNISIYRNLATAGTLNAGSFAPYVNFPVGTDPRYARVADLDGDGRPDIVSCNFAANTISILRNIGTAGPLDTNSFAPRVDLPAGTGPYDVVVGDLDGDGKPDLAVVHTDAPTLSLYRNLASPGTITSNSFAARVDLPALEGNDTIAFGDIDGDGRPDLVIGSFRSLTMSVYRNQASAGSLDSNSFAARVDFTTGNWTHTLALADLNGDGKTDIATVGELNSYVSIFQNLSAPGSFDTSSLGARVDLGAGWNGWGISAGDLDGDGRPDLVFCNAYDDTVSIYQNLTPFVSDPSAPPVITDHPAEQLVNAGGTAQFSVSATGPGPLTYQWFHAGDSIAGETNALLTLANVQPAQAGNYFVVVSNANGGATSSNALLTVLTYPPTITAQPPDQSVYAGKPVLFAVSATGTAPLRYQWEKNETPIANATNATLLLTNVQFSDAGNYRAIVTNHYGNTKSRVAVLTVRTPPVCVPVPSGAIAWWPAQSNTWDVLGGFDGVWIGSPSLYSTGKVGSAWRFASGFTSGSYIQVNQAPGLNVGAGAGLTIEGWIRPDSRAVSPIAEWNDGAGNIGAGLLLNPGSNPVLEATLTDTNTPKRTVVFRSGLNAVTNGVWQHVALTYDKASGSATILVNGLSVAQTNAGTMKLQTMANLYLGYRRSGIYTGSRFSGLMDEMSLYNRALSQTEVQSIVAADEAGKCEPPPLACVPPATGIAAWWRGESNTLDSVAGNHARTVPSNYPVALTYQTYQTGLAGAAFAFRGQNFLSVPKSDNLDLGKEGGLTIEGWILPTQSRPMPIAEWTDSNSFGASLWMSYYRGPTVLEANLMDASGGIHLIQSPTGSLTYNAWQHVALTYDKTSGQGTLFVNGNTVMTTNLGTFTPRTDLPLMLGAHPPNLSYTGVIGSPPAPPSLFFGAMDEIALYRRALNPAEIRNLARVRPGKCLELPPTIGSHPQDVVALENGGATFSVVAGGSPALGYQWFFAGQPIAGATSASLTLAALRLSDAGNYSVVVSNAFGVATSHAANLIVLPANQCLPTPLGAVAFWRGESNTLDELGNHPAVWGTNTQAGYTTGPGGGGEVGRAFRFTGSSYLQVPGNADLNVGAGGGFTVEGWIKPDTYTGPQSLVDWNDLRGNVGVGIMYARTGPGVLEVTLTDTNATSTLERTVTFATPLYALGSPTNPNPAWSHLALTFEKVSGKAILFLNGKKILERTIGQVTTYTSQGQRVPFTPATTGNLYFGWRPSGLYAGLRFRGGMDEMTVYYRALTPSELQSIYVVGANGKCAPQPSCLPLASSVAGWWRGESNLVDSVNTNNGAAVPSVPFSYTNGVAGQAMNFASGRYVRVPASPALNVGAGDGMTFESWMNPVTSSYYTLAAWNSGTGEQGVSFGTSPTRGPNYFEANLVDTAGTSHVMSAPYRALSMTNWQHVAVTYDKLSGQGVIFVNGSAVTVTNLGLFTPRTTSNLYLGYRPPGNYPGSGFGYVGGMDEVMVHGRALSSGEVTASYRNSAGRCMEPPVIVQQPVGMRVNVGSDVTLSVVATGNPLLRYQWIHGRSPIYDFNQKTSTNAQKPALTLTNVAEWQQGTYYVVVSNAFGFAVSSNALLLVNYPPVADASATVPLLISHNNTDAVVVLDGSRSRDPDRDALSFEWFRGSSSLATGAVAVVTLPVGAHPIKLVVNDGLLSRTNAITVEVITTAEAVERLIALVQSGSGNTQPLIASLRAALAAIDRGQPVTAINQLEAFINKVHAQVEPSDPVLAAQLIAAAQAIIDALNGGTAPDAVALEITSISHGNNAGPHLKIKGANRRTVIVETSTNLVDWDKVGVARGCGDCAYEFEDAQTPAMNVRYYRVVSPR